MHGGKSLSGPASPTYTTGRYSKVMPTHLADLYQQVQNDQNLLSIYEDIALQDTLLRGALDGMSRGEAGELWVKLKEAWQEYQKAKRNRKPEGISPEEALGMVGWLIGEGYQDYMARQELRQMLQERAKLVDMEGKRLERAQNSVRVTELLVVIDRLMEIVQRNVADRKTAGAIIGEFAALLGSGAPRSPEVAE